MNFASHMKKRLKYILISIPLYILCAVCFSCTQKNHHITSLTEELIELDDSLYFIPKEKDLTDLFRKLDSLEDICSIHNDHEGKVMTHHIRADLHIIEGHNALAFNETRKLLEISDCKFSESLYFLTLANIDTELNLFRKARERLLDASKLMPEHRILQTRIHLHLLELSVIQRRFNQAMLRIDRIERLNATEGLHSLPKNIQIRYSAWKSLAHLYFGDTTYAKRLMEEYEANETLKKSYGYDIIRHLLRRNYHNAVKEYDKALYHAHAYIELCKTQKNRLWELNAYTRTGNILEECGREEDALPYYQKSVALKDSLSTIGVYQEEEMLLKEEQRFEELEFQLWKKRHNLLRGAFIAGIIALILITFVILNLHRLNKKLLLSTQQLKLAQKKADESIQAKSLFLSNMSHEIRTPLNAIAGFSDILISQPDMDKEMRSECNNIIRENSMLLLKLLNDVLDLSNLDIEKMNFSFDHCDAVNVSRSIINMMQSIKHSSNANILFKSDIKELRLYTDENRLRQLLINLLINATKFTKEGNITLSLSVDQQKEYALFAVTDTGCGIPLEKQKLVFSRFEKLHENVSGTGLGLSICQSIIHRLGGDIWIDSLYTKGSRFVFSHPIPKNEKL